MGRILRCGSLQLCQCLVNGLYINYMSFGDRDYRALVNMLFLSVSFFFQYATEVACPVKRVSQDTKFYDYGGLQVLKKKILRCNNTICAQHYFHPILSAFRCPYEKTGDKAEVKTLPDF